MQLVLNISDEQFKDSIQDQIKAIDPKDLQGALVSAIKTYFTEDKYALEKLLFVQQSYGYSNKEPSDILKNAMAALDYSELQPLVDDSIKLLRERYDRLLRDMLMQQIAEQLTKTYSFQSELQMAIQEELYRREHQ